MPRNLDRRVEIMFPLEDEAIRERAISILEVELADTLKAHLMKPDGTYEKVDKRGKDLINSQKVFGEGRTGGQSPADGKGQPGLYSQDVRRIRGPDKDLSIFACQESDFCIYLGINTGIFQRVYLYNVGD